MIPGMTQPMRCAWADSSDLMRTYHDTEWGVPLHGDSALFEFLVLEGAQAGLSWRTVLERRPAYREAFHGFDIPRVARMKDAELERLLADPRLIRNRLKIYAARDNARAALAIGGQPGSLDAYLWGFVEGRPRRNRWHRPEDVPTRTEVSDRMSKDLRRGGFRFVGSTICYAFMQATGMVDDHLVGCLCHGAGRIRSDAAAG